MNRPINSPKGVRKPHPSLWIGGGGEKVTLKLVAQYADASNFGEHEFTGQARTTDDIERKLRVLRNHCDVLNRPFDSVLRTHITIPVIMSSDPARLPAKAAKYLPADTPEWHLRSLVQGTPADLVAYYRKLHDAGQQYFIEV